MEKIKVNTGHSNNHHTLIIDSELEPGQKLMPVSLTDFGKTL
jgi:hypothetical protein